MKKIEDYLKHYIGCDVIYTPPESAPLKCKLVGFTRHEEGIIDVTLFESDNDDGYEGFGYRHDSIDYIELLLRPLSSMTEEEAISMYDHLFPEVNRAASFKAKIVLDELSDGIYYEGKVSIHDYIQWVKYLLDPDHAFDLFELIDSGLALDSTKIEKV